MTTMQIKLLAYLVGAIVAAGGLWRAYDWAYDRGVSAERNRWQVAQAKAEREAAKREREQTATSEKVADSTRKQAEATGRDTAARTGEAVEVIRYVYRDREVCPAGGPGPVPAGVLDEFDQAVRAAAAAKD